MIRLSLNSLDDAACFVRAESIVAAYVDIDSPNRVTRVILETGGALQVKDDPEAISGLVEHALTLARVHK